MNNYKKKQDAGMGEYLFSKVQPQALSLEGAALGAIMLDRDALPGVIDLLKPESFYKETHQDIYRACLTLFTKAEAIDILTVTEQLTKDGKLKSVGGAAYVTELTNRVASSANLEYHTRIILQKALQRDLIQLSTNTIKLAYDEGADAFELLADTQKSMFDLANFGGRMAEGVGTIGLEMLKGALRAMDIPDGITGVPCGLEAVDSTTGGWQPTDLLILAARPGMGKTAFAICAALHAAKKGIPVAIFSLEMGKTQLVQRIASIMTGVSANRIKRGRFTNDEYRQLEEATQSLADVPIFIDDTPGISIFELRAKARRLKMQHGIGMVVIDYLQLMSGDSNGNRETEVSSISRGCKHLAKELNVPVLALSQLNRAVETRGGSKRPQLSDLRESGAIEQDADMVSFLYRPEYYGIQEKEDGTSTFGLCELIIAKHRHGALDDIGLNFDGPTTKFSDLTDSSQFPAMPNGVPAGVNGRTETPF